MRLERVPQSKNFEDHTRNIPGAPWHRARAWGLSPEQLKEQRKWIVDSAEQMAVEEWEARREGSLANFLRGYRDLGPPPLLTPLRK